MYRLPPRLLCPSCSPSCRPAKSRYLHSAPSTCGISLSSLHTRRTNLIGGKLCVLWAHATSYHWGWRHQCFTSAAVVFVFHNLRIFFCPLQRFRGLFRLFFCVFEQLNLFLELRLQGRNGTCVPILCSVSLSAVFRKRPMQKPARTYLDRANTTHSGNLLISMPMLWLSLPF